MTASARQLPIPVEGFTVVGRYSQSALATLYLGDRLDLLRQIPSGQARLVVTSPPYNIGKKYEKRCELQDYLEGQRMTLEESVRILGENGSLCWQVGNHVVGTEIRPLDILIYPICQKLGLRLRNRIIWHFEHGLHCSKRFSGRYETILWFTKGDKYVFNLDAVRVPQKYPGKKYFKGDKAGQYSCNPLGKNPGDLWIIPNVKHNHIEKTSHPCQFPIELIERLVLALTKPGDLVVDPYMGVGSTACAAVLNKRRAAGADVVPEYLKIARQRVELALMGKLDVRPMGRAVYKPDPRTSVARRPPELGSPRLFNV
jgi:adenine-specific DNA-methyltransferase